MNNVLNKIYVNLKENYKTLLLDLVFLFLIVFICFYNFPYLIYRPGGIIDITDRIEIEGGTKQKGSYNMSYVTVARGNIPNLLLSFIFDDWDLRKESDITISDTDYETTLEIEKIDMQNSLEIAKKVAFEKAGYEVRVKSKEGVIVSFGEDAKTDLEILDQIISIEGKNYENIDNLQEYIGTFAVGEKIDIVVSHNDKINERYAYVYEYEGRKVIGIVVYDKITYDTPKEMTFKERSSEAGSSGGLMLTLTIYDELVKEDLTSGKVIVGTGTINTEGKVGSIGGVKYKLLGAEKGKADIFFVPEENYDEAKKVYDENNLSFKLVKVSTIDDAIKYLKSH